MTQFTFNCKYDTIEAFLADTKYSSFIMKQSWFSGDKREELRNDIKAYKQNKRKEAIELSKLTNNLYKQYEPKHYALWKEEDGYSSMHEKKRMRNRFESLAKQLIYFRNNIAEELIATAMSPKRVAAEMSQFDDIEAYFEAMGC